MGYFTHYTLDIIGDTKVDHAEEISHKYGDATLFCLKQKWYEHDFDMRAYSTKYPALIFVITGSGEETNDIWRKYYRNGLMQFVLADITFPAFNPSELN